MHQTEEERRIKRKLYLFVQNEIGRRKMYFRYGPLRNIELTHGLLDNNRMHASSNAVQCKQTELPQMIHL